MSNIAALSGHPELRGRWFLQVDKYGKSVTEVCQTFGISRKTYYKWYKRDHGLSSFSHKHRRPHPQLKITGDLRVAIVESKESYNYGPQKMAAYIRQTRGVSLAPSTIYKFYQKRHLIKKPQKKQPWYTPLKEPYYAHSPGENVQLDVKYVPGHDGLWIYQFRFLDTVTNYQYTGEAWSKSAKTTIRMFHAAQRFFPFAITGIQTDNGSEFRGAFHEYLLKIDIPHRYIPKRSAPWNGKVERANRSVDDEFYLNPRRPWRRIYEYVNWYNKSRPHLGKGMDGLAPHAKYLTFLTCPQEAPV